MKSIGQVSTRQIELIGPPLKTAVVLSEVKDSLCEQVKILYALYVLFAIAAYHYRYLQGIIPSF